jgi:hypothetical protein
MSSDAAKLITEQLDFVYMMETTLKISYAKTSATSFQSYLREGSLGAMISTTAFRENTMVW